MWGEHASQAAFRISSAPWPAAPPTLFWLLYYKVLQATNPSKEAWARRNGSQADQVALHNPSLKPLFAAVFYSFFLKHKILIILENPSTRETETQREDEEEEDDNDIERLGAHGRKPLRKTSNLHTDRILVSWRTRMDSTATKIRPLFPAKTRYRSRAWGKRRTHKTQRRNGCEESASQLHHFSSIHCLVISSVSPHTFIQSITSFLRHIASQPNWLIHHPTIGRWSHPFLLTHSSTSSLFFSSHPNRTLSYESGIFDFFWTEKWNPTIQERSWNNIFHPWRLLMTVILLIQ